MRSHTQRAGWLAIPISTFLILSTTTTILLDLHLGYLDQVAVE